MARRRKHDSKEYFAILYSEMKDGSHRFSAGFTVKNHLKVNIMKFEAINERIF